MKFINDGIYKINKTVWFYVTDLFINQQPGWYKIFSSFGIPYNTPKIYNILLEGLCYECFSFFKLRLLTACIGWERNRPIRLGKRSSSLDPQDCTSWQGCGWKTSLCYLQIYGKIHLFKKMLLNKSGKPQGITTINNDKPQGRTLLDLRRIGAGIRSDGQEWLIVGEAKNHLGLAWRPEE